MLRLELDLLNYFTSTFNKSCFIHIESIISLDVEKGMHVDLLKAHSLQKRRLKFKSKK